MEHFRAFLHDTAGLDILNFWLDCENFKDTIEDLDDLELMITRNRLYRFGPWWLREIAPFNQLITQYVSLTYYLALLLYLRHLLING